MDISVRLVPPDQPIYSSRHRLFQRQASVLPHTGKCQRERLKAIQQTIQPGQDKCPFLCSQPFHSGLHLLLLIFLADLLTTIVGGRVLLTDIVTIFCIQSVPTNKFRFKAFPSISHKKGSKCLKPIFFRITTMTDILRCSEVL